MAFRIRQKMVVSTANQIELQQVEVNEQTGIGEVVAVKQCRELPKPETMDLGLMIKAGVPLDQVNSKLIDPVGTVGLADSKKAEESGIENKE